MLLLVAIKLSNRMADASITTEKRNNIDTPATDDNDSNDANDANRKNESAFVKLVRSVKIADLEKEIKEDGGTTSILGKFKHYEQDLIDMTQDGTKKEDIVKFVVGCIGLTDKDDATSFATRLLKAHPKQSKSNGI